MKLGISIVVVLAGLLLAAFLLNLTGAGREVVTTVGNFVIGLVGGAWSFLLGVGFFLLPFVAGRFFRRWAVVRLDEFFDANKPFTPVELGFIAIVFSAAAGGLQLFALQLVGANPTVGRFFANFGTTGPFGPVSPLAWFAYGFIGFALAYYLLQGRRKGAAG